MRRKTSSIKITEIYEAGKCKVNIYDETSGLSLSETLQYPCAPGAKDTVREKLIEQIKEMGHAKSDRHRATSVSNSAPALSNTPVAA